MLSVSIIGYGYWGTKLARNFQNSSYFNIISISDVRKVSLNLVKKNLPTSSNVTAARHSYVAIARPRANPDPFIATNCSADIFAAIKEAPIAHHGNDFPAKK